MGPAKTELTLFPELREPRGERRLVTWEALFSRLKRQGEFLGDKHPGWSPSTYKGDHRLASNVESAGALVLDIDGTWHLNGAIKSLASCWGVVHTTRSHTDDVHRFRVVLPLTRRVSKFEYEALWDRFAARYPGKFDPSGRGPERFWYMPGGGVFNFARLDGALLDVDAELAKPIQQPKLPPVARDHGDGVVTRASNYVARMDPSISGSGGHRAAWMAALTLVQGFGLGQDQALAIMRDEFNPRCEPPWSERELAHKVRSAGRAKVTGGWLNRQESPYRVAAEVEAEDEPVPRGEAPQKPSPLLWAVDLRKEVLSRATNPDNGIGVNTGLRLLNDTICGYRAEEVTVLGAPTNWGKSSWACMAADEASKAGHPVLIVTAEDQPSLYMDRLAARRAGVSALRMRQGKLRYDESVRLQRALESFGKTAPIAFLNAMKLLDSQAVANVIGESVAAHGISLVIGDYIQRFKARHMDRRNEVTRVTEDIIDGIKSSGAAGLLLSQLRRLAPGEEPSLGCLKESGDIENMAEVVILGGAVIENHNGIIDYSRYILVPKVKAGPKIVTRVALTFDDCSASFTADEDRGEWTSARESDSPAEELHEPPRLP